MTNKEIAEYLLSIASDFNYFFICNHLETMLNTDMVTMEEFYTFKKLLWSYTDLAMLKEQTKCPYLDHNYRGSWFKSKAGRIEALNKILTLT